MILQRLVKKRLAFSFLLFFFLQLYPIPYTLYPIYATDSTPSASVQQKLEALKKEIASKASQIKQTISQKLQNKVYVGIITAKTTRSLELETKLGKKEVTTNEDTINPKKPLKIEDKVAVLGDIDDLETLHAKKIVLLPTTNYQLPTFLWGQVITLSDQIATLKIDNKNVAVSLTQVKTKVKIKDVIIVKGVMNKNNILEASFVYPVATSTAQKAGNY